VPPPEFSTAMGMLSTTTLWQAALMLAGFIAFLMAGSKFLPGREVMLTDVDGKTRSCKINGLSLFLLTFAVAGLAAYFGWFSLSALYTHFAALFIVTNVFAFVFSAWLYWRGAGTLANTQAAPTCFWRGYFYGLERDPALFGVDLKMFSYRPSLIGLALLNVSFAVVQYETYGELTLAMTLYQIFTFAYIFNYFQFEHGMIHTWDIVSERFGWMLVWGDYALVPFFYCIAGWWLVDATGPDLPPAAAAALVLLFAFGFWLFRGANEQKHRFKQDPGVKIWGKPAETLDGRLLVSGFWGIGRHLNYTGEICVYLAFTLTAASASLAPLLLPAWLATLLSHRCLRDERRCRAKYGELWERYTARARFAMLPFVY